jgi:hypothetical protein
MADTSNRPLNEADEKTWHIRVDEADIFVRGAYPTVDPALKDSLTVIKDRNHKIVAAVRDESVVFIERTDAVVPRSVITAARGSGG